MATLTWARIRTLRFSILKSACASSLALRKEHLCACAHATNIHQKGAGLLSAYSTEMLGNFLRTITTNTKPQRQVILGIESSCDDTGAAVVDDSGTVLGESLHSQLRLHLLYGGINPSHAKRLHKENIGRVVDEALKKSGLTLEQIDAIATTVKPGLRVSLSVGTRYGKKLALSAQKPFIPIHHMEAHALTIRMVEKVEFPFLVLLVSGGHCLLVLAQSLDQWSIIGNGIDDAPGEAFDKGARRLKLRNLPEYSSMSGGQAIEHLAKEGNPRAFDFPAPMSRSQDCTFSFCGLKSSLIRLVEKLEEDYEIEGGNIIPPVKDVCASFQYSVAKYLVRRTQRGMIYADIRSLLPKENRVLVLSGGVACNRYIRNALQQLCDVTGYRLYCPPPKLCTDNGIMIAWNGMERWKAKTGVLYDKEHIEAVDILPKCPIGEDLSEDVRSLRIKVKNWVKIK